MHIYFDIYLYLCLVRRNRPGHGRFRTCWYLQRGRLPPDWQGGVRGQERGRSQRGRSPFVQKFYKIYF